MNQLCSTSKSHLEKFVKNATAIYDESHDYNHATSVRDTAVLIALAGDDIVDLAILETAAMVHDVCDHKYINNGSIPESKLKEFLDEYLKSHPDTNASQRVMNIVYCVSWSKQVSGVSAQVVETLSKQDKHHLEIVRDADRIMAIGLKDGIRRCRAYAFAMQESPTEESAMAHVVEYCREKLLRLYPENFIVTKKGREIAKPLHDEMQEWWDRTTAESATSLATAESATSLTTAESATSLTTAESATTKMKNNDE
jgi:HD superfamily phosphodiesterase